ncbi:MAG TPA: excinuclease ABC subunit UvrB [Spirochaetota bacterium]|nr:MAG: UvrABC system protein B [Spirochaetes bacterium ADurb.BinA120]HNU90248.1 excinuclease ABC subunit UvrB [Spirochaetota bacterium]HPV96371.1 excinuclease ABC subunit UvrB [Spirochaetota bacterium]
MPQFRLISRYSPSGDQEQAIELLVKGIDEGMKYQTLLGVTGSGKTFTMAKVIERVRKPALVLTHNKTLAAQLYREFREFFPHNAVEYFVSYYDYYQPEAYVASQDLYIEKDASINDEIDRLRLRATSSILTRSDVIVVSSVSCIYGLGSPEDFEKLHVPLRVGDDLGRDELLRRLVAIHYARNDMAFTRGAFRVRGDMVEVFPAYLQESVRVEFFGDRIEALYRTDPLTGRKMERIEVAYIYPAKHFVSTPDEMKETVRMIDEELAPRLETLRSEGRLLEAQRLESRTRYDMEMLMEMGYCSGIENYSRIIGRRAAGEPPPTLLNYFKGDFMLFVDESHVTLPQVRGMFEGDRSRKMSLVEYGFRLPSALDNRPLYFEEFERIIDRAVFVSATPADYELEVSSQVVEQVIRPTGLIDPSIEVRPAQNQVDDLIGEVRSRAERDERVLVTTLTKKMAEDLTAYLENAGLRAKYLHSEIETIERVEIIRDLRKGEFDCLVGINLLREGLDIPEVSLVAILDADKEGFLRSARSLIQTAGRAARNLGGTVIMYADTITPSMKTAIDETNRRREIQSRYNAEHGVTPASISKEIVDIIEREYHSDDEYASYVAEYKNAYRSSNLATLKDLVETIRADMLEAASNLEFEKAAVLRDQMLEAEKKISLLEKVKR